MIKAAKAMEAECLRRYLDELARCIDNHEVVTLVITQLYTKGVFTPEVRKAREYMHLAEYKLKKYPMKEPWRGSWCFMQALAIYRTLYL